MKKLLDKLQAAKEKYDDFYYKLNEQTNTDVEKYFRETLGCKYIPKGFLDFMKKYDGGFISLVTIYSINEKEVENYANGSRLADWNPDDINIDDILEFATNDCGDYYYFYKNKPDETIYQWTSEEYSLTYDSFNEWLDTEVDQAIQISEDLAND